MLLTLFHHLEVALDRDMAGRLVKLNFSAAFNRVSHCGLLKLRSIDVGRQFRSIVSEFLSDRRQRVRLADKVRSVNVVSGAPQGSVLESLLFTLYTSDLFHIVGNHIVNYVDDTVIPIPLSRQEIQSLN